MNRMTCDIYPPLLVFAINLSVTTIVSIVLCAIYLLIKKPLFKFLFIFCLFFVPMCIDVSGFLSIVIYLVPPILVFTIGSVIVGRVKNVILKRFLVVFLLLLPMMFISAFILYGIDISRQFLENTHQFLLEPYKQGGICRRL